MDLNDIRRIKITKVQDLEELARLVAFSNPEHRIHVLYKKDDLVYIFYSNGEIIYTNSDEEFGYWTFSPDFSKLIKTEFNIWKESLPSTLIILLVEVIDSDLIELIRKFEERFIGLEVFD